MTLITSLGRFVAELSPDRPPQEAVRVARTGFIDSIGTIVAGRIEDGDSAVPANVLFERLGALQSIDARDPTAGL